MAAVICVSAAGVLAIAVWAWSIRVSAPVDIQTSAPASSDDLTGDAIDVASVSHPIYRYSVVSGGVHSPRDVVRAVNRDRVVADHYRSLLLASVRATTLATERRVYLSYRIGDQVFWTKHTVLLPAGEPILTDGVFDIRARCGNRISDQPQLPTSDQEPEAAEFDALAPAAPRDGPSGATTRTAIPRQGTPAATSTSFAGPSDLTGSLPPAVGPPSGRTPTSTITQPWNGLVLFGGPAVSSAVPTDDSEQVDETRLVVVIPLSGGPPPDDSQTGHDGTTPPGRKSPPTDVSTTIGPVFVLPPGGGPISLVQPTIPGGPSWETNTSLANGPSGLRDAAPAPTPVPEPGTLLLVGTGAAGALWRRLRTRRHR